MNNKIIIAVGAVIVVGVILFVINSSTITKVSVVPTTPIQVATSSSSTSISSTTPLMQSTGMLFSQYKYFSKANEVFPVLATSTKKALGAFSYTKENLGNNVYRFTLTNNAEGYKGQSVIVSSNQSVYFIEPATGDDSASEDSITTDDSLMAVDAQGYILK